MFVMPLSLEACFLYFKKRLLQLFVCRSLSSNLTSALQLTYKRCERCNRVDSSCRVSCYLSNNQRRSKQTSTHVCEGYIAWKYRFYFYVTLITFFALLLLLSSFSQRPAQTRSRWKILNTSVWIFDAFIRIRRIQNSSA